jgi:nucleolar protein 15
LVFSRWSADTCTTATDDAAPIKAKKPKTPTKSTASEGQVSKQVEKSKTLKSIIKGASDSKSSKKLNPSDKAAEEMHAKAANASQVTNGVDFAFNADKSISKKHNATQEKTKTNGKQTVGKDDDEVDDDSDEIDDQTAALLKGFESDGDEEDDKINEGYSDGDAIPAIEANDKLSSKKKNKLKKVAAFPSQGKPGVVYVGRIPHGFYENEMRAYFSQFGNILKLRLSRNKKTGASRHFAFIQFESAAVAEIVAKTMDNYLMFGHILKVKLVPEEQVPANVFKGANKRFKKVPWNKIEGRKLEQGASEKVWDERADKEQKRRDEKAEKMKAMGYEFDSPRLKSAKNVSRKEKAVLQLTDGEAEIKAIEAAPATEDSSKPNKEKKKTNAVKEIESGSGIEEPSKSEKAEKTVATKPSRQDIEESVAALIAETAEKTSKKKKKDKSMETIASSLPDTEGVKPSKVAPTAKPSSNKKKDKKKKNAKTIAE